MRPTSGYWGSFLAHGTLLTLGCLFAADTLPIQPEPITTTTLVDLPGPDTPPAGVPDGAPASTPPAASSTRPATFIPVQKIQVDRVVSRWREARRREEEAAREAAAEPVKPPRRIPTDTGNPASSAAAPTTPTRRPIIGATVTDPTATPGGPSTGPGQAGQPGRGVPGGEGTGAAAAKDRLTAAFAAVYIPLFRDAGRDLDLARDDAVVKLRVSEAGLVTLAGWTKRPAAAEFERIITRAVAAMPPQPPPAGGPHLVEITVTGIVE